MFQLPSVGHLAANCPKKVLATTLSAKSSQPAPAYWDHRRGAIQQPPRGFSSRGYCVATTPCPTAKVVITVRGYQAQVEAVVAQLGEDMLLGRDLPFFNDLLTNVAEERQQRGNEVFSVSTRSQTRAAAHNEAEMKNCLQLLELPQHPWRTKVELS